MQTPGTYRANEPSCPPGPHRRVWKRFRNDPAAQITERMLRLTLEKVNKIPWDFGDITWPKPYCYRTLFRDAFGATAGLSPRQILQDPQNPRHRNISPIRCRNNVYDMPAGGKMLRPGRTEQGHGGRSHRRGEVGHSGIVAHNHRRRLDYHGQVYERGTIQHGVTPGDFTDRPCRPSLPLDRPQDEHHPT